MCYSDCLAPHELSFSGIIQLHCFHISLNTISKLSFDMQKFSVIPQTCKYKGRRFECGLSISCVLAGGKPVDSCSGGMIWSCCVDKDLHQESTSMGLVQNASKYRTMNGKCFSRFV